ncbi:unnamed protein product, partial [Symbiodinium sp. CCMP2456]
MASSRCSAQVDWESTDGIFLRNIPAKCDEQALRNFVQAKGVTDFSAEMAVFPNGNAKGFASFRFSARSGMQDFVSKVHGQFIPGFQKTMPLFCEPLRGTESRRILRSRSYMPAPSRPWAPGPREHSSISGEGRNSTGSHGKSKGTSGFSTMVSGKGFHIEPGYHSASASTEVASGAGEATCGAMVIDQPSSKFELWHALPCDRLVADD